MRILLFFDLPSITSNDKKVYRNFVKKIRSIGFYMLQESVYVKMSIDNQNVLSTEDKIRKDLPKKGSIILLNITEKQFSSMKILLGDNISDVITNDERTLIL